MYLHAHRLSFVKRIYSVHTYIDCAIAATTQHCIIPKTIITYDYKFTENIASKLQIEEVLQQIHDEQCCDSDDNCFNNDQDENLDDFFRLEDPLDKARAGNEEDDEDDETPDTTLSRELVSILPCNTPPDLPASSTILNSIHLPLLLLFTRS